MIVKVGICVAYDWNLLQYSLPALYPKVDAICLSIDRDNKSWNGNYFDMDRNALNSLVKGIDAENKIHLLEESFYNPGLSPIENECEQRRKMAAYLGKADWIVQIDTDEIFIDIDHFIHVLQQYRKGKRPVNIHGIWVNLIKKTKKGYIYSVLKTPPLATNTPVYDYGRTNGHFNIYTNTFLAHITWARPEEEVFYKLKNWGHSHEFNGMSFFKIWQALDDYNWRYLKDFHPMNSSSIPELFYQEADSIDELVQKIQLNKHHLKNGDMMKNNIWISRLYKMINKI